MVSGVRECSQHNHGPSFSALKMRTPRLVQPSGWKVTANQRISSPSSLETLLSRTALTGALDSYNSWPSMQQKTTGISMRRQGIVSVPRPLQGLLNRLESACFFSLLPHRESNQLLEISDTTGSSSCQKGLTEEALQRAAVGVIKYSTKHSFQNQIKKLG